MAGPGRQWRDGESGVAADWRLILLVVAAASGSSALTTATAPSTDAIASAVSAELERRGVVTLDILRAELVPLLGLPRRVAEVEARVDAWERADGRN